MASKSSRGYGFTLIELLVVISIISVISGLVVPALMRARERANILECCNNLQQIYPFALEYSEKARSRAFPLGSGRRPRAHESLNELLAFEPEALKPSLFVCPSSSAGEAQPDAEGRFLLDEETCSYAWTAAPLKSTAYYKPVASDKYVRGYEDTNGSHDGHRGMNVLLTDGSVEFLLPTSLPPDTMLPAGLTR
jgi:prepilin-type N-terminal cleavage/methylation domain-containing protein